METKVALNTLGMAYQLTEERYIGSIDTRFMTLRFTKPNTVVWWELQEDRDLDQMIKNINDENR